MYIHIMNDIYPFFTFLSVKMIMNVGFLEWLRMPLWTWQERDKNLDGILPAIVQRRMVNLRSNLDE
jgi:hypothetical protein